MSDNKCLILVWLDCRDVFAFKRSVVGKSARNTSFGEGSSSTAARCRTSPYLKIQGKKVLCVEKGTAETLAINNSTKSGISESFKQIHREKEKKWFRSLARGFRQRVGWPWENRKEKTDTCDDKYTISYNFEYSSSDDAARKRQRTLTIPLQFGLELMNSFPGSYLLMSSDKKTKSRLLLTGTDDLMDVKVHTIPGLKIVQFADDGHLPVEYEIAFLSGSQVKDAWKHGREYFVSASLASRRSARRYALGRYHAVAAALSGTRGGSGFARNRDSDDEGMAEPPEVQQLAEELGMGHSMPEIGDGQSMGGNVPPFIATLACGTIATFGPIVEATCSLVDHAIASIPIINSWILPSIPPRKAVVEKVPLESLIESTKERNASCQREKAKDTIANRLALSALWMGISVKLLARQYAYGTSTAVVVTSKTRSGQSSAPFSSSLQKQDSTMMMEVFGQLVGSLESNDFVGKCFDDGDSKSGVSMLDFKDVLSLQSGMSIEYNTGENRFHRLTDSQNKSIPAHGKGVILVGDFTSPGPSVVQRKLITLGSNDASDCCPVSVVDGRRFRL